MSGADPDGDENEDLEPKSLNRRSIGGLLVSVAVAIAGLFALPPLRSLGLSFMEAFWTTAAIEFVAFLGVAASVLTLYRERDFE